MKTILFNLCFFTLLLTSCVKTENVSNEKESLEDVKWRPIVSRIETCGNCCRAFWACVEISSGSQEDLIDCKDGYWSCMGGAIVVADDFPYAPAFVEWPDFTIEPLEYQTLDFKIGLYDFINDDFVGVPYNIYETVGIHAVAINDDLTEGQEYYLGVATYNSVDGVYEFSMNSYWIENNFGQEIVGVVYRAVIYDNSIPEIEGLTDGDYIFDELPLVVEY